MAPVTVSMGSFKMGKQTAKPAEYFSKELGVVDVSLTDIQINGIDKTAVVFVGRPIEFTLVLNVF